MAQHPHEYKIMMEFLPPIRLGGLPDFEKEDVQASLVSALNNTLNGLPNIIENNFGEGWTFNSHSLTFQGEVAILSIILQKERT